MNSAMKGHGHVTPNADGSRARCGGPSICKACRAELAAIYHATPVQPASVPDGFALVPRRLSAENGAKGALSGEFKIRHEATCSGCYYDEADPECEVCGGDVHYVEIITIDWTTIKEIYARSIDLLAAAPAPGDSQ